MNSYPKIIPIKRIRNYENMGVGLFIHWGLYSLLGKGEWTELIHNRDKKNYEKLIQKFTATHFDANKIVQSAKKMGAKYIVLTSKHHEGFFLYDSKGLSNFDSIHSAAKRDFIKEFVNACHKENIKPFIYMATYDWHTDNYEKNFEDYLKYLRKSVDILCSNYGKIGGFWFDGNWNKKEANWEMDKLYEIIRKKQPEAIIINNTGLKKRGILENENVDVLTYERGNPKSINHIGNGKKYVAGEISLTLNKHWGLATDDINYKSPAEIIKSIVQARCVGANILINIGLNGDGSIPRFSQDYMMIIGKWLKTNSSAIYSVKPFGLNNFNHTLNMVKDKNNSLYLFIDGLGNVGNDNVVLGGEGTNLRSFTNIYKPISKITWLDNNQDLKFMHDKSNGFLTIDANGFTYGSNWIIRVAKVQFKS
ncbi:alpha-L-fucosidase [Companilactobacillus halodurans]|uniref:alpha-L-fucosidase n=1 Tax=Companilactobacillus halodurans TaxID=2584183 RepID=A0A5P0ZLP5_9LACO|nr:alpha-L-fucosidase [Companilactobacillus halodurans]MQS75143.1 alpha-L-fucosidase [Companilactobacillus halodurans]MQS97593.1 alpha-L-fucosidase [Companilactobacillus halodurans]